MNQKVKLKLSPFVALTVILMFAGVMFQLSNIYERLDKQNQLLDAQNESLRQILETRGK